MQALSHHKPSEHLYNTAISAATAHRPIQQSSVQQRTSSLSWQMAVVALQWLIAT